MRDKSPLLFLIIVTFCTVGCSNEPNIKNTQEFSIFDTLSLIQSKSKIPGFGVAVLKRDSVLFCQGFGQADIQSKRSYGIETIQPIASISKTFIGLSLMKAVDQGLLEMETNINDVLPFKIVNPFHPSEPIKIRHLVTHTSGLLDNDSIFISTYTLKAKPEMNFDPFFKEYYTPEGKYYLKSNFSESKPGEQFNYSNIASALVAYMIEIKSKMSFPEFTSKYIFEPLQMADTHWFYDSSKASKYSKLYEITTHSSTEYKMLLNTDKSVKPYTNITYPDGKLYSSIKDMSKYLAAMINGYCTNTNGLISSSSFQELFRKQFNPKQLPKDLNPLESNRAVYWAYDTHGNITHTGSDYGLTTFILFNPQSQIGHVVFFNTAFDGDNGEEPIKDARGVLLAVTNFEHSLK